MYIAECADNSLYTGWTCDLFRRIEAHNSGRGSKYTKSRRPVKLCYWETFATKQEAMRREFQVKQLTRAQKLDLIEKGKRRTKDAGDAIWVLESHERARHFYEKIGFVPDGTRMEQEIGGKKLAEIRYIMKSL